MITLDEVTLIRARLARCFDLARSVEVHLASNVHCGESAVALAGRTSGLIELGERVTWRARHFGFQHQLTREITGMNRPAWFRDVMRQGIFRSMEHDHFFRALSPDSTEMRDLFTLSAPLPVLGRLAEVFLLRRYMRNLLRERHQVIRDIAESSDWQRYLS